MSIVLDVVMVCTSLTMKMISLYFPMISSSKVYTSPNFVSYQEEASCVVSGISLACMWWNAHHLKCH